MNRIVVVGGGAAGMMAAIAAKSDDNEVIILEKNRVLGKKIYITGKGRCNITNNSDIEDILKNVVSNHKFLYAAIYSFSNTDVIDFFNENGLPTKVERGNRVFPVSDKAADVVKCLVKSIKKLGIELRFKSEVRDIELEEGRVVGLWLKDSTLLKVDRVILATGGESYKRTGSDGYGIRLLKKKGIDIVPTSPSLTSFKVNKIKEQPVKELFSTLAGLSLRNVMLSVYSNNKKIYEEFGELLFTHDGLSGPIVLSASAMVSGKYDFPIKVSLDLKPALDEDTLDKRLIREFNEAINKNINNVMKKLLPIKLIEPILNDANLSPYKKCNSLTKEDRRRLILAIKQMNFELGGFKGKDAVVTRGGVGVHEINPSTMELKKIKGLYVAGEMIDLDALTGGYNLQIAWSTGHLAGMNAKD